jgi:hypothetical protein
MIRKSRSTKPSDRAIVAPARLLILSGPSRSPAPPLNVPMSQPCSVAVLSLPPKLPFAPCPGIVGQGNDTHLLYYATWLALRGGIVCGRINALERKPFLTPPTNFFMAEGL